MYCSGLNGGMSGWLILNNSRHIRCLKSSMTSSLVRIITREDVEEKREERLDRDLGHRSEEKVLEPDQGVGQTLESERQHENAAQQG